MTDSLSALSIETPRAYGKLSLSSDFRQSPSDFTVSETLGFQARGEGEHQLLHIEKSGENTHWVAKLIAQYAGIKERDVGFCGRKDRHAITSQWFSAYLPGQPLLDWSGLNSDSIRVLDQNLHKQKLRPGMHQTNHFIITLRNLKSIENNLPLTESEKSALLAKIALIKTNGVPNYFGPQRFGRSGQNLELAADWLEKNIPPHRSKRSLILSSARSHLFNQVLAKRVIDNNWDQHLLGEATFSPKTELESEDALEQGSENQALTHYPPSGPLWGRGRSGAKEEALIVEQAALVPFEKWCYELEHLGLSQERRALVLTPAELKANLTEETLQLSFSLPTGAFATSILAEISVLNSPH